MKKINCISVLFVLAFWAFMMNNITAQTPQLQIVKKGAAATETFALTDVDYIDFAAAEFVKVSVAPADGNWDGVYLIVHEATEKAFDGSLETAIDVAGNWFGVIIDDGKIAADETTIPRIVTITKITIDGYSIKTASGFYIGNAGTTQPFNAAEIFNPAIHINTVSLADPIVSMGGNKMRFNPTPSTGEEGRFAFFGGTQEAVTLYKLQGTTMGEPFFFAVDQTPQSVDAAANSTATISVVGNVAWNASVTAGSGYASIASGASGTGPGTVTVSFDENTSTSSRQATVTISTTADVATKNLNVTVTQDGALNQGAQYFVKVTSNLSDWTGDYLIVYEGSTNGPMAFKSSLNGPGSPLDVAGNTFPVTINGGKIEATTTALENKVEIAAVSGGYSIMTASGYYIGNTTSTNTLAAATTYAPTTHLNTISLSGGDAFVMGLSGYIIRCNPNTQRFVYFGTTQQQPVALYKLE